MFESLRAYLDGAAQASVDRVALGFAEEWGLEPLGNWAEFKRDSDGDATWDLKQARTHNKVNETTEITKTVGADWADPAHDAAGNMTTVPYPASPTDGLTCTYLCSCQLAGAGFLGTVGRRSSRGTGRSSFSQSSIAA